MMHAADVMRPVPPTVAPGDSLARAAEAMDTFHVREMPVLDAGRLVGILARADLSPHVGQLEWTLVRTAMTPSPITIEADAPLVAVARALLTGGFNGIPVVAGEVVAGMIRRQDLLRLLVDTWGGLE